MFHSVPRSATIDYSSLGVQHSDDPPVAFSYMNDLTRVAMVDSLVPCHITHTHAATHDIIKANIALLPTFEARAAPRVTLFMCPCVPVCSFSACACVVTSVWPWVGCDL